MSTIKFIHESYSSLDQIISLVKEGMITLTKRGTVNYIKHNYVLKNDTEMKHSEYGHSWEDDSRLTRLGVPRNKVVKKGTKVTLSYEMWGYYLLVELKAGDYTAKIKRTISEEEYKNAQAENMRLFFDDSISFSIIDTKVIHLKK